MTDSSTHFPTFRKQAWTVTGIVLLTAAIVFLFTTGFSVLLLVFLSVLIATLLRGTAAYISRKTEMKTGWAMTITIGAVVVLLTSFFWFIGYRLQAQLSDLADQLPQMIEQAKNQLGKSEPGQKIADRISEMQASGVSSKTMQTARQFFSSTFGAAGNLYVILLLTLFLTAAPMTYVNGMVKLLPARARERGRNLIEKVGTTLYKWFAGTLFSMTVVAILTGIGLTIIGVPLALSLALLAGLLAFIPNFGPVIAMVLGVLVGLLQGPETALWVAGLYVLVQVLESNLITPLIQKKMIAIPPALAIVGQLLMGLFAGTVGLMVATPFVAMLMTIVQELWVKPQDQKIPEPDAVEVQRA